MPSCEKLQQLHACGRKCVAHMVWPQSLLLLIMRLWMANIFWKSGLTKIDDWQKTVFLFTEEYKVPVLPPEVAAFMGTAVELTCPVLLAVGLMTRLATLPMLAMTLVIQLTYLSHSDHAIWAMLLGTILLFGPGRLSLDALICKRYEGCKGDASPAE